MSNIVLRDYQQEALAALQAACSAAPPYVTAHVIPAKAGTYWL